MSLFSHRPALRWLVPAAAAAAVVGGGALVHTVAASAQPSLPQRSAAQLLVDLQTARLTGLSGTLAQRSDLGLPDLAGIVGGQGGSDLATLATGRNTLRVWYAGPDAQRLAILTRLGESDVIHSGRDVWTWSSRDSAATHRVLPDANSGEHELPADLAALTPQQAAEQALAAIDPSTRVSTGSAARVAGRDAYELVLSPRGDDSLVGQVRLAVDAQQHVPLRVQVYPRGSDAVAFEVAFTQISFDRPGAERFRFNPPPGTAVTELPAQDAHRPAQPADAEQPVVDGDGWRSVLVARMPAATDAGAGDAEQAEAGRAQLQAMLDKLPKVDGAWGSGRLLTGRLFSVLVTDDGRVLAGPVTAQRLYEVAGAKK